MNPTNKLRWVRRKKMFSSMPTAIGVDQSFIYVEVLQQWWEICSDDGNTVVCYGEWRDIPVEEE